MSSAFTYGTIKETYFHCQMDSLFLEPLAGSTSSLSPMMSPHFSRMTCKDLTGLTKVMDNQSWSQNFSLQIGVTFVMVMSLYDLFLQVCYVLTILCREARITFKSGLNQDGYFDSKKLINQVKTAINIFEGKTKGFAQGLFMFDNAPSHQKRADNALSARRMPKRLALFFSNL